MRVMGLHGFIYWASHVIFAMIKMAIIMAAVTAIMVDVSSL